MQKNYYSLVSLLLSGLFCGHANAAGFQLYSPNNSELGTAYAGSAASAENASIVNYNPAGMSELSGSHFSGGAAAVISDCQFSNQGSTTGALSQSGNGGNACELGFIPNLNFTKQINHDFSIGIGFFVPFGLATKYDNPWVGAANSIKFDIKTVNLSPAIAYRVNDVVSLGLGIDWQRFQAKYTRLAGTYDGLHPLLAAPFSTAGVLAKMNISDNAWGWNAGALFRLSPATKLGISYRSAIKYTAKGEMKLSADGSIGSNNALGALTAVGAAGSTSAKLKLPDMWIASLTHQLNEQWELLGDVSRTGWSSIQKINIETPGTTQVLTLDFRNSWRVALGANYKVSEQVKLRFGLAYDQSPTQNVATRNPALPDSDRTWLTFGTQWKQSKDTAYDFGVAYIRLKDSAMNNNSQANLATSPQGNQVSGNYSIRAWVVGAQYSQAF